ncbi:MAG: zinc ABC transporter substrate-binding protein [Desulfobacterales bacterium]|nr:zinc ABC transporter substrate-binding protein [Desulfobacterales bacterium]
MLLILLALPTLILGAPGSPMAAEPIQVFVSILPQQYLVQQIGAEQVSVQTLVAPGADPHTYEPKPGQMADLTKARLYFSIGMSFEKAWLPKIAAANPGMKVVAGDQDITKLPMAHHGHEESHTHALDHDEESLDPHVWLAPPLVKTMAQTIRAALVEAAPAHAARFEEHYRQFARQMDDLDGQIRTLLAGKQGTRFIAFHPSWGYFANAYGLVQIPVEIEGKEPKAAQMRDLIRQAREMKITVIFAQPQFSTRSAQQIADEIGGQVILADPLAADLPANLLRQAQAFQAAAR